MSTTPTRRFARLALLAAAATLLAGACDGGGGGPTGPTGPGNGPGAASTGGVKAAHAVPQATYDIGVQGASLGVQAVYWASVLNGGQQAITTGTLTQQGQSATYSASPADRLVVSFQDGTTLEFTFQTLQGDLQNSAESFFGSDHHLVMHVSGQSFGDLDVTAIRANGQRQATLKGSVLHESATYNVDLTLVGTHWFDIDSTGSHFIDNYQVTGTVDGASLSAQVDETWAFEMVTSNSDGGGSASTAVRTLGTSLTLGGDTYQWVGVKTQKSFKDGKVSQLDSYWDATGTVTKNGQSWGSYALGYKGPSPGEATHVTFVLDTPAGAIELEAWNAY